MARSRTALGTQVNHRLLFAHRAGAAARRRLALGAVAMAVLTLAACAAGPNDVQKLSGPEIVSAAARALSSAGSYRIEATSTVAGNPGSITFDVAGQHQGEGKFTSAAISFQAEEMNGIDYFRSTTLWSQFGGASLQADLGNRWVYIAASSSTAAELTQAFTSLTSPKQLALELTKPAPTAVRGRGGVFDGQPAVAVNEPPGGVLYVATTGPAYPLGWVRPGVGSVTLRDFGQRFRFRVPQKPLNLAAILAG